MSQMSIPVNRGTAYIHTHVGRVQRFELLFFSGKCIIDIKRLCHIEYIMDSVPVTLNRCYDLRKYEADKGTS